MKRSVDELKLYIDRDISRTTDEEEWIFQVEFPLEKARYNLFLTVDERGKILSLTTRIPDETDPSKYKVVYYASEGIDVFKRDVREIYDFDINDLVESLSDDLSTYTFGLDPDDIKNGIKKCEYSGKEGIFHEALIDLQQEYSERIEENDMEK